MRTILRIASGVAIAALIGSVTAAFSPKAPATVTQTAVRGSMFQATDTLPPLPPPTGLHGKPFAPAGLDRCDELQFYRKQWGLPDNFDRIGFKESSCRNDVSSWCCHGFFQLHRLWIPTDGFQACGITKISDMLGNEPIKKQRNACGAAFVLREQGCRAWVTC